MRLGEVVSAVPHSPSSEAPTDLMSEEEFQSVYAEAIRGGRSGGPEEIIEGVPIEVERRPPVAIPQHGPAPSALVSSGPLTFAEAQKALSSSADREHVAQTVLRFAVGKWKRAVLLSVQGELLSGWHGAGEGLRAGAVRRIGVALRGQSTFKLVCDTRSHFVGPMKRDAGTIVFFRLLGGDCPTTAVLLPVLVRGRVVQILYVDNGPGQVTPPDIGELLILSQSVARSYEAMINAQERD